MDVDRKMDATKCIARVGEGIVRCVARKGHISSEVVLFAYMKIAYDLCCTDI